MYSTAILQDTPVVYWPLDDPTTPEKSLKSMGDISSPMVAKGELTQASFGSISTHENIQGAVNIQNPQYNNYTYSTPTWFEADIGMQSTPSKMSVECWFKFNNLRVDSNWTQRPIISSSDGQWSIKYSLYNVYPLLATTGTSGWTTNNGGSSTMTTTRWQHVVMTWDGSTISIYLDGALLKTGSVTGSARPFRYIQLGGYPGGDAFSDIQIAHAAYYNYTLSDSQVKRHYDAHKGTLIPANIGKVETNTHAPAIIIGKYKKLITGAMILKGTFTQSTIITPINIKPWQYQPKPEVREYLPEVSRRRPIKRTMNGRDGPEINKQVPNLPYTENHVTAIVPEDVVPAALANLKAGYAMGYSAALRTTIRRHTPIFINNRSQ